MCLDGCCTYQTKLYVEYGQKNGLSPEEYLDKIFKFQRVGDKKVVFLKVTKYFVIKGLIINYLDVLIILITRYHEKLKIGEKACFIALGM